MCGIFALLNYITNEETMKIVYEQFMKGSSRGPEFSTLETIDDTILFGFHRLAINGLNEASNQPFIIDGIALICNGEIYNYKDLYKAMAVTPKTGSDCEVIIHAYLRYGIEQTLTMLDGVFAFVLYDSNNDLLFVARDPLGVRPLYMYSSFVNSDSRLIGFASELKCLEHFYNMERKYRFPVTISPFNPGTYSVFKLTEEVGEDELRWVLLEENPSIPYFALSHPHSWPFEMEDTINNIARYLSLAVKKRCLTTERPIACLLSGGLDSSLITALVNDFYRGQNGNKLETYSIGLEGSEDLKYAKKVADYLDTNHTEILVTEQEMFDAIPEVIQALESYDTTTVRASLGNYLLGKYIRAHSDAKVIFNGDGSDELFGGYLYMNKCPDSIEFDRETRRLLKDIYLFDVLRSDKSISSHGLEPRTPFLDKSFVNYVLSIPPEVRNHKYYNNRINNKHSYAGIEKFILRDAFSAPNYLNGKWEPLLPDEILWRKKEAFSDGVSSKGRSLYQILQEKIAEKMKALTGENYEANIDTEKAYYKRIFDELYPNCAHVIPYYWMPKYTDAKDPSARTLDLYNI
jgi:asparagine synthase (glutamine-hydrolysing)